MPDQINEIKTRLDIVDIVGEYVKLKPAGSNFRALCPFHNEKTPSFMVSRDKQIWHCFGCSEGGDVISFVQKIEGLEFPEALRRLAHQAGVKLTAYDPKLTSQKNRLLDICSLAASFWHTALLESKEASFVRQYVAERRISEAMVETFKLGYAPDSWDSTMNFLKKKGFSEQEIFLAGLTVKKERGAGFYDRFRNRLLFPINDIHGNPVGFSGRTLQESSDKRQETSGAVAKYINTPQTLLYNKSQTLFNLDRAKQAIKKNDLAILVEGQMDALAAYQAGTENVIASSGTALTIEQIKLLKRFSHNLAIAFDADSAGQSAAKRGIDLALAEELNVKVIVLPGGQDPDDCIRQNPADWFEAVKAAQSIMQYYFDETLTRVNLRDVEGKKQAARVLLPVIAKIGNKIEQTHWLQKLADALQVPESILRETLPAQAGKDSASAVRPTAKPAAPTSDRYQLLCQQVLALGLKFPEHIAYLIDSVKPELFPEGVLRNLYKALIIYYTESIDTDVEHFEYDVFLSRLDAPVAALADRLVLLAEKDFFDFEPMAIGHEFKSAVHFLKRHHLSLALKTLEHEIKQAEHTGDSARVQTLSKSFEEIVSQLHFLD